MPGVQPIPGFGHADVVVEVTFGGQQTGLLFENALQHGARRGLAGTAGQGHDLACERLAQQTGQLPQGLAGIRHDQLRHSGIRLRLFEHQGGSAGFDRCRDIGVAVKLLAFERHIDIALFQAAGVSRDPADKHRHRPATAHRRLRPTGPDADQST